jgi:hypothetical protein
MFSNLLQLLVQLTTLGSPGEDAVLNTVSVFKNRLVRVISCELKLGVSCYYYVPLRKKIL